ncbi:MAG: helix-turn-helix transcriptional regulator [Oscillospiraceae bacterium]|nr:helix-turn-helix transcriptional regulator [Oscillospiraceae bacterium]
METKKNTTELLRDLKKSSRFSDFAKKRCVNMQHPEFTETFNRMYKAQGRSKAEIARISGTSEAYLYQIFSGARIPSRDRLLCICLGMSAELDDTQLLLKQCGYAPLYVRDQRDAIIMHGLMHATPLGKVNDMLFEYGEKLLLN